MAELQQALDAGLPLKALFNTSGGDYKALDMKTKLPGLSPKEALTLLHGNGNLVKRPFLLHPKGVLVGFDEAAWTRELRA